MTPRLVFYFTLFLFPGLGWAGFPLSVNNGSMEMKNGNFVMSLTGGQTSGVVVSGSPHYWIGYHYVVGEAYNAFLQTGLPLSVHPEPAGAATSRFIESPNRALRLSWSEGRRDLQVRYRVYLGETPHDLKMVHTTPDRFHELDGLEYLKDYFWMIEAFDVYGRATKSAVFSFSIAPSVGRMYAAPNPFRAGAESTTFIFNMPGPGSAKLSIYLLPAVDLVNEISLGDLPSGINIFVYHGTDSRGQTLYNGVYWAVLDIKGTNGHVREKFKLMVVK